MEASKPRTSPERYVGPNLVQVWLVRTLAQVKTTLVRHSLITRMGERFGFVVLLKTFREKQNGLDKVELKP